MGSEEQTETQIQQQPTTTRVAYADVVVKRKRTDTTESSTSSNNNNNGNNDTHHDGTSSGNNTPWKRNQNKKLNLNPTPQKFKQHKRNPNSDVNVNTTTSILPACLQGTAPQLNKNTTGDRRNHNNNNKHNNTDDIGGGGGGGAFKLSKVKDLLEDPHRIEKRQKQVDYGKNTIGYDLYRKSVPKADRKPTDPQTPEIKKNYSKRQFDGILKKWRKQLHQWDPKPTVENEEVTETAVGGNEISKNDNNTDDNKKKKNDDDNNDRDVKEECTEETTKEITTNTTENEEEKVVTAELKDKDEIELADYEESDDDLL